MRLAELALDVVGTRSVVIAAEFAEVRPELGVAGERIADFDAADDGRVVVDRIGDEFEVGLLRLAAELTASDLGIAVLDPSPSDLPVPLVIDAVSRAGLTALQAVELRSRFGSTALVVSIDPSSPLIAYVRGDEIGVSDASIARLRNEWVIESLHLRALVHQVDLISGQLQVAQDAHREVSERLTQSELRLQRLEGALWRRVGRLGRRLWKGAPRRGRT